MTRNTRALTTAGSALVLGLALLVATPAAADSVFFSYSSGYHRHRHHNWRHHHHRWHHPPRYHYGYYHYAPPPVVYAPPPVVYAPPQVVYAPPPPLAAVPTSPVYRAGNGQYCREYQTTVTINGVPQPSYGTACLQADGAWRVVD